jgi:hypothetical protein
MSYNWNRLAQLSAIGAVGSLAIWLSSTSAKEETSVLVNKPAATATAPTTGPILPPPTNPNEQSTANATSSDPFAPPAAASKQAPLPLPPQTVQPTAPVVKRPFMRPAQPREPAKGRLVSELPLPAPPEASPVVPGEAMPAPAIEGIRVQPTPPIEYDTDHDARKMYRTGKIDLIMLTKDPATDCAYEIPMCIPACCVGDPKVSGGRGILGRGVVEYCWPCGFRAIVKFRHILGDVKVEFEGD